MEPLFQIADYSTEKQVQSQEMSLKNSMGWLMRGLHAFQMSSYRILQDTCFSEITLTEQLRLEGGHWPMVSSVK